MFKHNNTQPNELLTLPLYSITGTTNLCRQRANLAPVMIFCSWWASYIDWTLHTDKSSHSNVYAAAWYTIPGYKEQLVHGCLSLRYVRMFIKIWQFTQMST